MKKHQPSPKEPRARKKPAAKGKPSITSRDAKEAGKLYAALAIAAEFAAEQTEGDQRGLFMQAMRLAAQTLADLKANHKSAEAGMDEALAILSPEAEEITSEQV